MGAPWPVKFTMLNSDLSQNTCGKERYCYRKPEIPAMSIYIYHTLQELSSLNSHRKILQNIQDLCKLWQTSCIWQLYCTAPANCINCTFHNHNTSSSFHTDHQASDLRCSTFRKRYAEERLRLERLFSPSPHTSNKHAYSTPFQHHSAQPQSFLPTLTPTSRRNYSDIEWSNSWFPYFHPTSFHPSPTHSYFHPSQRFIHSLASPVPFSPP